MSQSLKTKVRNLPDKFGVYMFKDGLGRVIYVGKAISLKKRVSQYFMKSPKYHSYKIAKMLKVVEDVETLVVKSEPEALNLESKLIREFRPKYNTLLRDDKNFYLIRIDVQNAFASFKLVRNKMQDNSKYYGPFISSKEARKILEILKEEFEIITDNTTPIYLENGKYKLYDDARAEVNCKKYPNETTKEDYAKRVNEAIEFLDKQISVWTNNIFKQMQEAASKNNFEKAASLRDIYLALKNSSLKSRKFENPLHFLPKIENGVANLKEILKLEKEPKTMECFDISHISGSFLVASCVRFKDGAADKKNYRRYKIKTHSGNDDFKSMREVVKRRYLRLNKENKELFPDLILIDGGKGQVSSAIKMFEDNDLPKVTIIGLAKRFEHIIKDNEEIQIEKSSPALRLLQRIRDESHRFANSYNAMLRSKKIRESLLDELKGLGQKKKIALINHFKNISSLQKASVEDICKIDGIAEKTAIKIKEFLDKNYLNF